MTKDNKDDKENQKKKVEQPEVDPSLGVDEENYNEFWKEKKEKCEEEKQEKPKK